MPRVAKRSTARQVGFEHLDERLCLSIEAVYLPDSGVLSVNGSAEDDTILIRDNMQGQVIVQSANPRERFEFEGVLRLVVNGLEGNDTIKFHRHFGHSPLLSAEFDLGAGDDKLEASLLFGRGDETEPTIELDVAAGEGSDDVQVGLLLPAVQKVREAAARLSLDLGEGDNRLRVAAHGLDDVELDLAAGGGNDDVVVGLLLPAVQKVRDATARASVNLGGGNDRLSFDAHGDAATSLDIQSGDGDDAVLIGLLLPAVQKVREAAAAVSVDLGAGHDLLSLNIDGETDTNLDIASGDGDDAILIGLLLPAVQKVRDATAVRADIALGSGNDFLSFNLEGEADSELAIDSGEGDDSVLIGLLLPAVQKVREAAAHMSLELGAGDDRLQLNSHGIADVELDLAAGDGSDDVHIGLLLPAVQKVRDAAARLNVDLGSGNDRLFLHSIGVEAVDAVFSAGEGADQILIGLLLPAVQKVRDAAARVDVDLGPGSDSLVLRARNYETVETEITSDEEDVVHLDVPGNPAGQSPRRDRR